MNASRPARSLLACVVALGCASVLGVADFRSAADELCALLKRCYGDDGLPACAEHVGSGLSDAEEDDRLSWLTAFADRACLENCTSARGCLDIVPVCNATGQKCDVREHCCGFSRGLAACDLGRSACCVARGVSCQADDDCCEDAGRCQAVAGNESVRTCGGVVCKLGGEACVSASDCCSSVCDEVAGVCVEQACFPDGSFCGGDKDCCTSPCIDGFCGGVVGCGGEASPCLTTEECCDGLECVSFGEDPSGGGVCTGPTMCVPDFEPCFDPSECCSTFCNFNSGVCESFGKCGLVGDACELPQECCSFDCTGGTCQCVADDSPCIANEVCCNGSCLGGFCQTGGCIAMGGPGCDHEVCIVGGPLSVDCMDPCVDVACVQTVCAVDDFCCTTGWDSLCVTEASDLCGAMCPAASPQPQ